MSTIYRTLLMVYKNCEEWNAESGPDGIDFLQIQWQDCDNVTQGITLYPIDGLYTFCVKGGTSPLQIAFNGAITLEPTGNVC